MCFLLGQLFSGITACFLGGGGGDFSVWDSIVNSHSTGGGGGG